ncbi:E3 ubiquitin-protein ligase DCST1 [Lingula anatina]|uniref:E3 ubiquitin-protein ligase DCST1 n=1 Tax=Lingula anatina TaxID=7574 RepID=A0A1S3H559_LINAN|nr:E3 ubiquitin-protein ligase DCST1 [Lingula anatina]|eukprot:XP_013381102.2 E3 ubiquitin-protein ligase DCST1 [Lingula anatina]
MLFADTVRYALGGMLAFALAMGCAMSVQVRCISGLVIPQFFGKEGRSFIGTFAIAYLLTGPIANIMFNAEEVTRVISCSTELMMNQTMKRMDLKFQPIHHALMDMQRESLLIKKTAAKIRTAFKPIETEVEVDKESGELKRRTDEADVGFKVSRSQRIEKSHKIKPGMSKGQVKEEKFERKLDYKCEDIYNAGINWCRGRIDQVVTNCKKALDPIPLIKNLCDLFNLKSLCEVIRWMQTFTGIDCTSMEEVNKGFGDGYETAERAAKEVDKKFNVNMQYKLSTGVEKLEQMSAQDVTQAIKYEFEKRKTWFDFITLMIKRILAFLFIRVFIGAYSYHKRYVSNFGHDNIYISKYFKSIDARRNKQNKMTLLPLKRVEKKERVEPQNVKLMGPEKAKLGKSTFVLFVRLITAGIIIFVDRLVYEVLAIISRHSKIEYHQSGEHHIQLIIYGKGVIGQMVKSLLKGFNRKHILDSYSTNFECLPQPSMMPSDYIWKIVAVYLAVWFLMFLEAYGLRLRRIVASFFYPKREKKRILYLYNDMLKKRKGFLRHMRHRIKSLARENKLSMRTDLSVALINQFPRLCSCLKVMGMGKKRCLICEEPQNKEFHICATPGCNFVYCKQCWKDVKHICYACASEEDFSSDESELTDTNIWSD